VGSFAIGAEDAGRKMGSDSSASDDETAALERPRKHSKETPLTKDVPKSSAL
jgi:hypothetical protein